MVSNHIIITSPFSECGFHILRFSRSWIKNTQGKNCVCPEHGQLNLSSFPKYGITTVHVASALYLQVYTAGWLKDMGECGWFPCFYKAFEPPSILVSVWVLESIPHVCQGTAVCRGSLY
jgi:hypothetical protein